MLLRDDIDHFDSIVSTLNQHGILQDFILIGSWVLRVYQEYFKHDPEVPILATKDLDFLVTNPPQISNKVNIPALLEKFDLMVVHDPMGNFSKYVGPDFEVEFLYPEKGRGEQTGKYIKEFGITATPLRYLIFIQSYSIPMIYKGFKIVVPRPEVFVLMKYLLSQERSDREKIEKDIKTAAALETFLLRAKGENGFKTYFNLMPKKWRMKLMKILKTNESDLVPIL